MSAVWRTYPGTFDVSDVSHVIATKFAVQPHGRIAKKKSKMLKLLCKRTKDVLHSIVYTNMSKESEPPLRYFSHVYVTCNPPDNIPRSGSRAEETRASKQGEEGTKGKETQGSQGKECSTAEPYDRSFRGLDYGGHEGGGFRRVRRGRQVRLYRYSLATLPRGHCSKCHVTCVALKALGFPTTWVLVCGDNGLPRFDIFRTQDRTCQKKNLSAHPPVAS